MNQSDPLFRTWLQDLLKTEHCTIEFTKIDGTPRTMLCTLNPNDITPTTGKTERKKTVNPDVLVVWDLQATAWRSFRYDSIQTVNFKIGEPS